MRWTRSDILSALLAVAVGILVIGAVVDRSWIWAAVGVLLLGLNLLSWRRERAGRA